MRNTGGKRSEQIELPNVGQDNSAMVGQQIMVGSPRGGAPRLVTVPNYTYGAQPATKRAENKPSLDQVIFLLLF
jgi:hypothetical protein